MASVRGYQTRYYVVEIIGCNHIRKYETKEHQINSWLKVLSKIDEKKHKN